MAGDARAELFTRFTENPILRPEEWPYPVNAVFNAGATIFQGETLLLVRVEDRRGFSHLTVVRSKDGVSGWRIDPQPVLAPEPERHPEERWGIEDPRITRLEEEKKWAVLYTAYAESGPLVNLAFTEDFQSFTRIGPVLPPENKDAALFPVRFRDRWAMLHRPVSSFPGTGAHIWISYSPDLVHWGSHRRILAARRGGYWDSDKIGLAAPPLATPEGWLILYHGVRSSTLGGVYRLGLSLLDLENPERVIRRSSEWVFAPRHSYERIGDVNNVVFPCGWILEGSRIRLYYGAADTCVALATAGVGDLIDYLKHAPSSLPGGEGGA